MKDRVLAITCYNLPQLVAARAMFDCLPPEILEIIARRLSLLDYATLRECSKACRDALDRAFGGRPGGFPAAPDPAQFSRRWMATRRRARAPACTTPTCADDGSECSGCTGCTGCPECAAARALGPHRLDARELEPDKQRVSACVLAAAWQMPKFAAGRSTAAQLREFEEIWYQGWRDDVDTETFLQWGWLADHIVPQCQYHHEGPRLVAGLTWELVEATVAYARWLLENKGSIRRLIVDFNSGNCHCRQWIASAGGRAFPFPVATTMAVDLQLAPASYQFVVPPSVAHFELWLRKTSSPPSKRGYEVYISPGAATKSINVDLATKMSYTLRESLDGWYPYYLIKAHERPRKPHARKAKRAPLDERRRFIHIWRPGQGAI